MYFDFHKFIRKVGTGPLNNFSFFARQIFGGDSAQDDDTPCTDVASNLRWNCLRLLATEVSACLIFYLRSVDI